MKKILLLFAGLILLSGSFLYGGSEYYYDESGTLGSRSATSAETTVQTRDDVWLSPSSIPYIMATPGTIGELKLDHTTETLNADRTILITDNPVLWFDCNGTDRNVTLPPEAANSTNLVFTIVNVSDGTGEDLIIRDDTPTTLITLSKDCGAIISCDGTSWKVHNKTEMPTLSTYGIMWNENTDTYIRIGDPYLFIHDDMRRCILSDAGVVQYYLEEDTSYNKNGVAPSVTGTCDANATNKITDTGVFTGASADYVGRYVKNTTDNTYAMITTKDDNDTLSLQIDIFVIGETFEICTAVLNGDDGQVMVEIPAFYHKYSWENGWHQHSISYNQTTGYNLHHAFQKNGTNVTHRYIGAYGSALYDTSESKYVNGLYLPSNASYKMSFNGTTEVINSDTLTHPFTNLEAGVDVLVISGTVNNNLTCNITGVSDASVTTDCNLTNEAAVACVIQVQRDWTVSTGDVLGSVSGKASMNYGTRANFRAVADTRGVGWRQQAFDLVSAVQLLYLVEYGSWYSQSEIGAGLTDWSAAWPVWSNYNPIERTGLSNALGNATGSVSNGNGVKGSYMTFRGIENFYGHLWKWIDGFNVNNNIPYVCNNDTHFADGTVTNYTALGVTLAASNGYQKTLEQIARGFLPASVGGSSSTYITDKYSQASGWRVARLGGSTGSGVDAGVAYWNLLASSGSADSLGGSRLSY